MENPRLIKKRVKSVGNIGKITRALEMVSAAKVQKAQEKALRAKPYAQKIYELVQNFAGEVESSEVPLLYKPEIVVNQLYILVSTNRGLAGSLNTNLFKKLTIVMKENGNTKKYFVTVGKKGRNLALLNGELLADYSDNKRPEDSVSSVSTLVTDKFLNREVDEVYVVYSDFISAMVQEPRVKKLLPIEKTELTTNKESMVISSSTPKSPIPPLPPRQQYNFEPSATEVLRNLLPYYLETEILEILFEAEASEHSARMVAMKNASENSKELSESLLAMYNGARQQAITSEINDIVTAGMTTVN